MWRDLKGQRRWYAQLVNEGEPYQKPQNCVADGLLGLDLNISNIAFVGDKKAGLLPFAEHVLTVEREIKALQRQMQPGRPHHVNNQSLFSIELKLMSLTLAYCENFRRSLWGLKNNQARKEIFLGLTH